MNKVIYFTNAVDQEYFKDYLSNWKVSPNLSNQNFHYKLINAISTKYDVEVISVRAINSNYSESKLPESKSIKGNIKWIYPRVSVNKLYKALLLKSQINRSLELDDDDYVIFVDTLNYSLVKAAYSLHKKKGYKIIGVCTDNPYNISFTSSLYINNLMKYATKLDGYVVLTKGINEIYNKANKPFIQIDGVNEDREIEPADLIKKPYIYFGGSLMEEYGVYNLIEAFKELNLKDVYLVICGHHVQKEKLEQAISGNDSIKYLGPVDYEQNLSLERSALMSVNPRPINPKIDDYSIPSKTLECLAAKCLCITVENKLLKENYEDVIIWANSSNVEDLKTAINKAFNLSKEAKSKMIEDGYKKVMSRTSQKVIGEDIEQFLSKFFFN